MTLARRVTGHVRSTVIAYVALFLALSGGSFAIAALTRSEKRVVKKIAKKQADKRITARAPGLSVQHAGAADSAINATNASSAVSATSADHASTADSATSAATAANGAQRIDFIGSASDAAPVPPGPGAHKLLDLGGLTVSASCVDAGGGQFRVYVSFGSSVAATLSWDLITFNNPGHAPIDAGAPIPAGGSYNLIDITGGNRHAGGVVIYREPSRTISMNLTAGAMDGIGGDCHVYGTAVAAPN
jgi:hypothetical protein